MALPCVTVFSFQGEEVRCSLPVMSPPGRQVEERRCERCAGGC